MEIITTGSWPSSVILYPKVMIKQRKHIHQLQGEHIESSEGEFLGTILLCGGNLGKFDCLGNFYCLSTVSDDHPLSGTSTAA